MSAKKSDSYYQIIAESKGFIFCGIDIINNVKYVRVVCPNHRDKGEQLIQTQNLRRNKGCKYCAHNVTLTNNEFKKHLKEILPDVELLGEYNNQKDKIKCKCLKHDCEFESYASNLIRGITSCPQCKSEHHSLAKKKTSEEFAAEVKKINPHVKILEDYKESCSMIKCLCLKHNKEFTKYSDILRSKHTGCSECYKEDIRKRMGKTTDQFISELAIKHPELKVLGEYTNRYSPIKLYCSKHDYIFYGIPYQVLSNHACCPKGSRFVKENRVGELLDEWEIAYVKQYSIPECKDKRPLPFDYYLIDLNIKVNSITFLFIMENSLMILL